MRPTLRRITGALIGTSLAISAAAMPVVAQDSLDALDFGTGTAILEFADERYEFEMSNLATETQMFVGICRSFFGVIQAAGHVTDGRDITIEMDLPPADWESYTDGRYTAPNIEFTDADDGISLVAGGLLTELLGVGTESQTSETASQTSVTENDGYNATGSATFVSAQALLMGEPSDPIEATFEVHCDPEE